MMKVAYSSPFVPPEWIAAHDLRPVWLPGIAPGATAARRGVCRCANLLVDPALEQTDVAALVLTTICDQMRYAAAYLEGNCQLPVFLLNVPSTWQGSEVRQLYREELSRLGRFCESLGGRAPSPEFLQLTIQRYEEARAAVRGNWPAVSDGHYAERLAELRNDGTWTCTTNDTLDSDSGVPLALVGGPLLGDDFVFLEQVAAAGGRIVLDASEWGERTLPAPLDRACLASDPLAELCASILTKFPTRFVAPIPACTSGLASRSPRAAFVGSCFGGVCFVICGTPNWRPCGAGVLFHCLILTLPKVMAMRLHAPSGEWKHS